MGCSTVIIAVVLVCVAQSCTAQINNDNQALFSVSDIKKLLGEEKEKIDEKYKSELKIRNEKHQLEIEVFKKENIEWHK